MFVDGFTGGVECSFVPSCCGVGKELGKGEGGRLCWSRVVGGRGRGGLFGGMICSLFDSLPSGIGDGRPYSKILFTGRKIG